MKEITIDVSTLYTGNAKLSDIDTYVNKAKEIAGEGNIVIITGAAPIWLYLRIAHAFHGIARKLIYRSPITGDVIIFDHSPD